MSQIISIDGSMLEGGGQILRSSIALSALTLKPIRVFNIRAKRRNPGLQAQHLTAVKVVAALSDAEVRGAYKGSMELVFIPRRRVAGSFKFDIGTAGSISLVLQAAAPVASLAPGKVTLHLTGGTDVAWSPPIDYMRNVFSTVLSWFGPRLTIEVHRRGHYPRGGGRVTAVIEPVKKLKPIKAVKFGKLKEIRGISHCVKLPKHVAERQAAAARKALEAAGIDVPIEIEVEYYDPRKDPHLGPGSGIVLWAISEEGHIIGADALGERGKPAEVVGREAAQKLLEDLETGMALDRHMADMVIPYMAVADGESEVGVARLTLHALTNIKVTEIITGVKFEVQGELDKPAIIRVKGLGLEASKS